jgi:hypothetical protein
MLEFISGFCIGMAATLALLYAMEKYMAKWTQIELEDCSCNEHSKKRRK